jgi:hypothetical protein
VVRALDQYLEYGFITLILWMLFFCLCAHWMACIFFAIADHYDKFAEIGWVSIMAEQTMQPLVIVNGTVKEAPTLASLYMSSLYFSLTSLTSIGFGNIAPNTTAEKIFSCVTMIFGGTLNKYFPRINVQFSRIVIISVGFQDGTRAAEHLERITFFYFLFFSRFMLRGDFWSSDSDCAASTEEVRRLPSNAGQHALILQTL